MKKRLISGYFCGKAGEIRIFWRNVLQKDAGILFAMNLFLTCKI